jgi:hypothetical protein
VHLWHEYWSWVGGNVGAVPLELPADALLTLLGTAVFWRPLTRAARRAHAWLHSERDRRLDLAQEDAAAARKIAADLYEHVTGEKHRMGI